MKRRSQERLLAPGEVIPAADLFERLEQQTMQLNGTSFAADFNALRKVAEAAGDMVTAARLDLERAAQLVGLSEYGVTHFHPWENPVEAEKYLPARRAETANELLRLRYGLVWLVTLPRGRHTGKLAAEMVADIRTWLKRDRGRHEATQTTYFELVQFGLLLSQEYRQQPDKMRELVLEHLLDRQQDVALRWWQLQFFGQQPDLFSPAECGRLEVVSEQIYDHYKVEGGYIVQLVCEAAIPLAARATNNARTWHGRKGDYLKQQAEERYVREPTSFIVQTLLTDALACYWAANDKQQMQEVERLLSATKHNARLNKVELSCTLDGPVGELVSVWLHKMPAWVLEEDALVFWRLRYNLIPGRPRPTAATTEPALVDLFRPVSFDRNRNITTRQQEQGQGLPFSPYSLLVGFYQHMTFETFAQGLQSRQLTYATTLAFLREQTWLGQTEFQRGQDDADAPGYTLIPWIEPALRNYFAEMDRARQDESYTPDLMLCMDSLTLKMEGILRHFCQALDPPIATNRRGRDGDQQELTLEEVIRAVEEYSGQDAGYWLRFVFTKEGWNLRNNVAHGFLRPQDYSVRMMQMVILALFVLGTLHVRPDEA